MIILSRYLASAIASSTLLALGMLVALVSFIAFVDDLGNLGKGSYGVLDIVRYLVLRIPGFVYELLPPSALLGSLLGLGALGAGNELVAMRVAGVSVARIVVAVLLTGLMLMGLSVIVGEYLAPASEKLAQGLRAEAIRREITVHAESGYWVRDGDNYINVRDIFPGGVLRHVYVYEFDPDLRLRVATYADTALYVGDSWQLTDVKRSVIGPEEVQVRRLGQVSWVSTLTPEILTVVEIKPENLSAAGLYRYIRYLEENGLDSRRYRLAMWQKGFRPVYLIVMLFISIPFVLGPMRVVSVGQRILVGALVGIAFSVVVRLFGHAGLVYGLNPLASSLIPAVLFFGAGVYGLRRVR